MFLFWLINSSATKSFSFSKDSRLTRTVLLLELPLLADLALSGLDEPNRDFLTSLVDISWGAAFCLFELVGFVGTIDATSSALSTNCPKLSAAALESSPQIWFINPDSSSSFESAVLSDVCRSPVNCSPKDSSSNILIASSSTSGSTLVNSASKNSSSNILLAVASLSSPSIDSAIEPASDDSDSERSLCSTAQNAPASSFDEVSKVLSTIPAYFCSWAEGSPPRSRSPSITCCCACCKLAIAACVISSARSGLTSRAVRIVWAISPKPDKLRDWDKAKNISAWDCNTSVMVSVLPSDRATDSSWILSGTTDSKKDWTTSTPNSSEVGKASWSLR